MRFEEHVNGAVVFIASYVDRVSRMVPPHDRYLWIDATDTLTRLIQEAMFKGVHILIYFVKDGQIIYNVVVPETCVTTDIDAEALPLREDLLTLDEMMDDYEDDNDILDVRPWSYEQE